MSVTQDFQVAVSQSLLKVEVKEKSPLNPCIKVFNEKKTLIFSVHLFEFEICKWTRFRNNRELVDDFGRNLSQSDKYISHAIFYIYIIKMWRDGGKWVNGQSVNMF